MKNLTRNSNNHVLKILCTLLLLCIVIFGVLAQERVNPEEINLPSPDKSSGVRITVDSDALINGLTFGRGGGDISSNTTSGYQALSSNITGWGNTVSGNFALFNNTKGILNIAIGRQALYFNTEGNHNTANGESALFSNTTGHTNTAIGPMTLHANKANSGSTAIGFRAMYYADNRAEGRETHNTAVGSHALRGSTTAANNTGRFNTAIGSIALYYNTTGDYNTASGDRALYNNTAGSYNTAIGSVSLATNITGHSNTASGYNALYYNTTGSENTAVGRYAGGLNTNINQGTFIGRSAFATTNNLTNVTGIGYNARPNGDNTIHIGNTTVAHIRGQVSFTTFSDGNYKTNILDDVAGLDFILKLRPVSYNVNIHKLAADVGEDETLDKDGNKVISTPGAFTLKSRDKQSAVREVGFVAQEVEALVQEMGVAFNGVDAPQNETAQYGLRYASFVVPLVKAVQEQQAHIEALSPEGIETLQAELVVLRAENVRMQGQINDILAMLENMGVDQRQIPGYGTSESRQQSTSGNARLEQNTPNPFHENTLIRYFLPEGTHRAQIIIKDMGGTQVMAFPLEHQGAGQVMIHAGTLPSGTYVYTLTMDGRRVDSKRMVLL